MTDTPETPPADDTPISIAEPTAPPAAFAVSVGNAPMSADDIINSLGPAPEPVELRADVPTDRLPQPAAVSDKTLAELQAGRETLAADVLNEVVDVAALAASAINARTTAEQQAGRDAVARRQAEIDRGRMIQQMHEARRLHENLPPEPNDLSYNAPS